MGCIDQLGLFAMDSDRTRMRLFSLFTSFLVVAGASLVPCTSHAASVSEAEAQSRVRALTNSIEKRVALAVIRHPDTVYRIDEYGYPAWRWRGQDDIGSCVHIDPKSGKPYLENQFARTERSSVPKYIDFGTDGSDWQCRIHVRFLGFDIQRNWSNRACNLRGRALVNQLADTFGLSR